MSCVRYRASHGCDHMHVNLQTAIDCMLRLDAANPDVDRELVAVEAGKRRPLTDDEVETVIEVYHG